MNRRSLDLLTDFCMLMAVGVALFCSSNITCWAQAADQAERDFAFAEGLYGQENYQLATEKYVQFVRDHPDHANMSLALFRIGECHFRLDRFAEAVPYFQRVADEFPGSEEAEPGYLWLGDAHYQVKDYQRAAAAYETLLRKFPNSKQAGRAAYWRGECYYHLGQYEEAIASYRDALKRNLGEQEVPYAHYSIGLAYLQLEQPQEAVKSLSQVLTRHANSPVAAECQYLLGTAYRAQENFPAAIEAFRKVLAQYGDSGFAAEAQAGIAWCYFQQNDYEGALRAFKSVADTHPDSPVAAEARLRAADCLYHLQRWDRAAELYAQVGAEPTSEWADEALYWLGVTYEQQGEAKKALAAHTRLVNEHRESQRLSDAHFRIGQLQSAAGNNEAAIAAYQAAADAAQDAQHKQQALAHLAWARYQQDGSEGSLAELERVVKDDPESALAAELSYRVAHAHFGAERYQRSLEVLQGLVASHPEHERLGEAFYLLAACHEKLGHEQEAEKFYRQVLEQGEQSEYLAHATAALVTLYATRGELDQAQQLAGSLERSGASAEAVAFAFYTVAEALSKAEKHAQAVPVYLKALKAAPESETAPYAQLGVGWAKLAGGDLTAAEAFQAVIQKHPDSEAAQGAIEGVLAVGEKLFAQEQYAQAQGLYQQIVDGFPESEFVDEAQYGLAWALLRQDKGDEALPLFSQAAAAASSPAVAADARYQAALLLADKGEHEQVAELLEPFRGEHAGAENAPWALVLLGRASAELGRTEQTLQAFNMVVTNHPDHPAAAHALLGLARCYRQQKQFDQALEALQKITAAASGQVAVEAQYELAACRRDKGELKEAAEEFLKVAILYGDKRWAAQAQFEAGQCYEQLQDADNAVKSYQVIINRYPDQEQWVEKAKACIEALQR